jgi:molybdopterin-guanine dinucleotide biosynthesis protein B
LSRFDRVIIADWSAASARSPAKPSADAIWLGSPGRQSRYFRTRQQAEAALLAEIDSLPIGQRLLIGFDFPMGYPAGFAARLTGQAQARAVWAWLAARLQDDASNRNNRFEVAAEINRKFGGGPFWGRPAGLALPDLPTRKTIDYQCIELKERRAVERLVPRAQAVWKLYTTGAAGSQGLMGQAMLHRLAQRPDVAVWPFDRANARIVLAEVYPSLLAAEVAADPAAIKDEAQVRLLAQAMFRLSQGGGLAALLETPDIASEEGWILGAGHVAALRGALT